MGKAAWAALDCELEHWGKAGRGITLWWRDDDAVDATPALNRLLDTAGSYGLSVGLAVIPDRVTLRLAHRLEGELVSVLQHGVAHVNRAPPGRRRSEFPDGCDLDRAGSEILGARCRLDAFGSLWESIFVPPWNRIDSALIARLTWRDFLAVSAFGPAPWTRVGGRLVNTHVDVVDWRGQRGFVGHERALGALVDHLAYRRRCAARLGAREPWDEVTGLLTHHLVHDEPTWSFLDELVRNLDRSGLVRWLEASELTKGLPARSGGTPTASMRGSP